MFTQQHFSIIKQSIVQEYVKVEKYPKYWVFQRLKFEIFKYVI